MFGIPFGPKTIPVNEAYARLSTEGHVLLDVRTRDEIRALGIPGALHITLDQLEARAHELSKYSSIHVICRSGGRSAMAVNLLNRLGFSQVESVAGGILSWQAAGLPTA